MKSLPLIAAAMAALCMIPCVEAQTVNFTAGTQFNAGGIAQATTMGRDMSGMLVTWMFVDGGGGSGTWNSYDNDWHGAWAGRVGIFMPSNGNTTSSNFYIVNSGSSALASIRFNGAPGRTLFDCDWNGTACGGPGGSFNLRGSFDSENGVTAETSSSSHLPAGVIPTFTYSNLVGLGGAAPVGDLFEQLLLEFSGQGLGSGYNYQFRADTDNSLFTQSAPSLVPEPSTYALLAAGLAVLAAVKRRRRISA
jgi:hypothetical protein